MRPSFFLSSAFAVAVLAAVDLRNTRFESLAGLNKRDICYQTNPTCESCFGAGSVPCSDGIYCYNPTKGDVCCADGSYCYAGNYCVDGGCCPNGDTLEQCGATVTLSTLAPPATTASMGSSSSSSTAAVSTTSKTYLYTISASTTPSSHASASATAYTYTGVANYTPTSTSSYLPAQQTTNAGNKLGEVLVFALGGLGVAMLVL